MADADRLRPSSRSTSVQQPQQILQRPSSQASQTQAPFNMTLRDVRPQGFRYIVIPKTSERPRHERAGADLTCHLPSTDHRRHSRRADRNFSRSSRPLCRSERGSPKFRGSRMQVGIHITQAQSVMSFVCGQLTFTFLDTLHLESLRMQASASHLNSRVPNNPSRRFVRNVQSPHKQHHPSHGTSNQQYARPSSRAAMPPFQSPRSVPSLARREEQPLQRVQTHSWRSAAATSPASRRDPPQASLAPLKGPHAFTGSNETDVQDVTMS